MARQNLLRCSLALVGLVVATAAFGADPTPTPATPTKPEVAATAAATDGLVCRNRLRPGSHIKTLTCLTAAQWASRSMRNRGYAQGYAHEGAGYWGTVSTAGASIGMSAFTAR